MIQDGIYKVAFSSSVGAAGEGLIVITSGAVNGGDLGYLYQGHIEEQGAELTATLDISQYNSEARSVFWPLADYTLTLKGAFLNANEFKVTGSIAGQTRLHVTVDGELIKPLAGYRV